MHWCMLSVAQQIKPAGTNLYWCLGKIVCICRFLANIMNFKLIIEAESQNYLYHSKQSVENFKIYIIHHSENKKKCVSF